jgi:hypothetical protein
MKDKTKISVELEKIINSYADVAEKYEENLSKDNEEEALKYCIQKDELYDQFKEVVLTELGLAIHKNADEIFKYAWNKGSSEGIYAVLWILQELAEVKSEMNILLIIDKGV